VERADIEVATLQVDDEKATYILYTHDVTVDAVFEVWQNAPRYFVEYNERGPRYSLLGPNRNGRFLVVAIAPVDVGVWRVVTAYWIRDARGRRRYEEN
jgi:hypothetical protein